MSGESSDALSSRSGSGLTKTWSGGMSSKISARQRALARLPTRSSSYQKQETIRTVQIEHKFTVEDLRTMMSRGTTGKLDDDFVPGEEIMKGAISGDSMANLVYMAEASVNHDVQKMGIYRNILAKVIAEDEWQRRTCLTLPSTLLFMFLFTVCFQYYYDIPMIYQQEASIRNGFGGELYNFKTADEVYNWLEFTYFPYLWTMPRSFDFNGDALRPASISGTTHFELLAGVLLHTGRSKSSKCQPVEGWSDRLCDPEIGGAFRDSDPVFVGWSDNQQSSVTGGRRLYESAMMLRRLFGLSADDEDDEFPAKSEFDLNYTDPVNEEKTKQDKALQNETVQDEDENQKREARWNEYRAAYEQYVRDKRNMLLERSDREHRQRREIRSRSWKHAGGVAKRRRHVEGVTTEIKKSRGANVLKPWTWGRLLPPKLAGRISGKQEVANSEVEAPRDDSLRQRRNRRLKKSRDELVLTAAYPSTNPSSFTYGKVITVSWDLERIKREINLWREQHMLDRSTLFFSATSIIMNHKANLITVARCSFSFSRGGNIFGGVSMTSINMVLDDSNIIASLACWLVCVLILFGWLLQKAISAARAGKLTSSIFRLSSLFDWGIVLSAFCITAVFFGVRFNIDRLKDRSAMYNSERSKVAANKVEAFDNSWFRSLYSSTQLAVAGDSFLQIFVSYYMIILICKYLLSSRGQPRLAIVVNTVAKASIDLLHLAIVLAVVLLCFVASGHLLFGRRMYEFSTLVGSFAYTMRIVFQREYDWQSLSSQDIYTALFWVFCLLVFVVLILFNLILAIIFQTYRDLRLASDDGSTVFGTISHLMTRITLWSTWQSNHTVLTALLQGMGKKPAKRTDRITAEGLRQLLPEVCDAQINYIFKAARRRISMMITGSCKNILPDSIATILIRLDDLHVLIQMLGHTKARHVFYGAEEHFLSRQDADQECHDIGAPMTAPLWIENAVVPLLQKRQKTMQTLTRRMKQFEDFARQRGIVPEGDLHCPLPEIPNPFPPGSEPAKREAPLINMPRQTNPHWSYSNGAADPSRSSTIVYDDGSKYLGQLNEAGLREGIGRYVWQDGNMYDGQWLNDKAHGHGTFTLGDKYTYQGQWMDNLMHGAGEETFADGTTRQGFWNQGATTKVAPDLKISGHEGPREAGPLYLHKSSGMRTSRPQHVPTEQNYQIEYDDGAIYKGDVNNAEQRHGNGKQEWPDGGVYDGSWVEDIAEGFGVFTHPDGFIYTGQWTANAPNGEGEEKLIDGSTYSGLFLHGERHGVGIMQYAEGSVYNGAWEKGKPNGKGLKTDKLGDTYDGDWRNGMKHGKGVITWTNGEKYEGDYWKDKKHGVGFMKWPDGSCYAGAWKMDKQQGYGMMIFADGSTYKGQWLADKMHGAGKLVKQFETDKKGTWIHGVYQEPA